MPTFNTLSGKAIQENTKELLEVRLKAVNSKYDEEFKGKPTLADCYKPPKKIDLVRSKLKNKMKEARERMHLIGRIADGDREAAIEQKINSEIQEKFKKFSN